MTLPDSVTANKQNSAKLSSDAPSGALHKIRIAKGETVFNQRFLFLTATVPKAYLGVIE